MAAQLHLTLDVGPEPTSPLANERSSAPLLGVPSPGPHASSSGRLTETATTLQTHGSAQLRASAAAPGAALPPGRKAAYPARAAAQQSLGQARQKDKFVPLPKTLQSVDSDDAASLVEEKEAAGSMRITAFCLAESFNRKLLEQLLKEVYPPGTATTTLYPDCVHLSLDALKDAGGGVAPAAGAPQLAPHQVAALPQVFIFMFGAVVMFGLDDVQQANVMQQVLYKVRDNPYAPDEVEVDQFLLTYTATEAPHIKNDTFTVNTVAFRHRAKAHTVQLAIAYAVAQSVKLNFYEEQVWDLVEDTKDLPKILATTGKVAVTPKHVARLIGRVFLQGVQVNLLSTVLDTPPIFWNAPDHLEALYHRACEYLELETRVEVLNARFQVLSEMLELLRRQSINHHGVRLEWTIIIFLLCDAVLMMFQMLSLFGLVGKEPFPGGRL